VIALAPTLPVTLGVRLAQFGHVKRSEEWV
jgi:hypothetical protein